VGDLIVDPFTGSSTTGIAALDLGRRFIGIDKAKKYLDLSKKRINHKFRSDNLLKDDISQLPQGYIAPRGQGAGV
jgi:DNA modification methylase